MRVTLRQENSQKRIWNQISVMWPPAPEWQAVFALWNT